MWQWLWHVKNNVDNDDRQGLLTTFRSILYSETEDELSENMDKLYEDPKVVKYPKFIHHLEKDTFPKIEAWCLKRRIVDELPTGNHNTNNLVESSFRYTKDIQFNRMKAFNLTEMLHIVLDSSQWYVDKAIFAANNRIASYLKNSHSKYSIKKPNIDTSLIKQISPSAHTYMVPSESKAEVSYVVDMESRYCSCPLGKLTGPCKHKVLVAEWKGLPSFDVIPTASPTMRQLYMYIGTGSHIDLDWFLSHKADAEVQETESVLLPPPQPVNVHVEQNDQEVDLNDEEAFGDHEGPNTNDIEMTLERALTSLKEKIKNRIAHDPSGYQKALKIFEKSVERLPSTVDSSLQKTLSTFGKSVTQVKLSKTRPRVYSCAQSERAKLTHF